MENTKPGKVLILACVDPRLNKYIDALMEDLSKQGTKSEVLRNAGCNVKGMKQSLETALARGDISEIRVLAHEDCAAMKYVKAVLEGTRTPVPVVEETLIGQFRDDDIDMDALDTVNRTKQVEAAKVYLGGAAQDGYVELGNMTAKEGEHSVVLTIEEYGGKSEDIANALGVKQGGMYYCALQGKDNQLPEDLVANVHPINALLPDETIVLVRLSDNDALYNAAEKMIKEAVPGAKVRQAQLRSRTKQKM